MYKQRRENTVVEQMSKSLMMGCNVEAKGINIKNTKAWIKWESTQLINNTNSIFLRTFTHKIMLLKYIAKLCNK